MNFIKKQGSNFLFGLVILLLIIPQTRIPIQVFVQSLLSFSPPENALEDRELLQDYNWELLAINTIEKNLQQSKNKVVIINLWATWCPPCIAEMPDLQNLFTHYKDEVDFYFISHEDTSVLQNFLGKKGFKLPVFQPLSPAPKLLKSNSLPTTFLISKKGEIHIKKIGAANWNSSSVHELLDRLIQE